MPLLVRWPAEIEAGAICTDMVLNVDFAPTFLDAANLDVPHFMQGASFRNSFLGAAPDDWQTSMYYRYWMHRDRDHNIWAHYGVRTHTHKLIYFYNDPLDIPGTNGPADAPEWELYDLVADPFETSNIADHPDQAARVTELQAELRRLQEEVSDEPFVPV